MHKDSLRLDLACGQSCRPGFVGVDLSPSENVAYVTDLFEYPWPFEDNSVAEVFCSHFVEHVPDLIGFMNEMWRIMEDGAKATIIHPYQHSNRAWQDPTHVRALNEVSWIYYNAEWRRSQRLDHYPITANFDLVDITAILSEPWRYQLEREREFAMRHYNNVVDDLIITLQARKK